MVDKQVLEFEDPSKDSASKRKDSEDSPTKTIFLTPADHIFEQVKDYALVKVREEMSGRLRTFKEETKILAKTKSSKLLAKLAQEKKYMRKYREHFALALRIESNLQKPVALKLY